MYFTSSCRARLRRKILSYRIKRVTQEECESSGCRQRERREDGDDDDGDEEEEEEEEEEGAEQGPIKFVKQASMIFGGEYKNSVKKGCFYFEKDHINIKNLKKTPTHL